MTPAAATVAPTLSDERLAELLKLAASVDSVELKLTVPETALFETARALKVDPLEAQIRQVFFFDTPDLALNEQGVVVRARRVQGKRGDCVVKLRPVVPEDMPKALRQSPSFFVELDAMPGGVVCSAALKSRVDNAEVSEVTLGERPLAKIFSKQQRAFLSQHAPDGPALDELSVLGPIPVMKLKFEPEDYDRRLVLELWLYPDGSRVFELSTKCEPRDAFNVAARVEGVPVGARCRSRGRAADEDEEGARLLLGAAPGVEGVPVCRWMAYLGEPVLIDELLFKSPHGIVDQSLHARMGAEPTNGDGFGLGWYGTGDGPGVYRSVSPAWGDPNLRELAAHMESPLFLAHVRAAIGSPVQETNCHPFRHNRWLFVHNGFIADFRLLRRDLMLAIDPDQFAAVEGSTDTEVVFHLALSFGLEEDPIRALELTVGLIEETAGRHGTADAVQASFGVSDGTKLWAVRYASDGSARSLFASNDVQGIRHLYPDNERLAHLGADDRLIVSEPFSDLPGVWQEIPQATAVTVERGGVLEERPFRPATGP